MAKPTTSVRVAVIAVGIVYSLALKLSGVSLDGRSFFYPNPLESSGQREPAIAAYAAKGTDRSASN